MLNIESLFNVIYNDGSHTLNSTKIYVDSEQQTLNSVFKSIQTTVGGNSTLWGSAIKQSKDFIDQKLWWTDIRNGESIESKFNTVTSTLDSFGVQIGDVYKQLNDDFKVYQVTYEPTKDNYPANEWSVPIYPSDDRYPSDSTWEYTEAEYDNYVGIIAYWEAQNRAWRWIKKIDGTHGWKEISSTEIAYLLNQNAALKVNLNTISSELSKTQIDIRDNYSTTVQVNNAITQAITKESNSIKLEVSNNYATKKSLEGYATTASLDLYIKKEPTSGELKSAIEAIADDITLNASGTINISGNKSVNVNGNLFTLTSTNTTISADGTIRCDNLISSNAKITGGSIDIETDTSTYSAIKLSYGDAYLKESPYSIEMYNPNVKTHNNIDAHGVSIIGDDNVVINAITDFGVDIRKGVLYVDSEATVRFDTDCNNISIYHPSLARRCYPAMYTNNPVTFDWDGSVLRIYVDDTVVASWDWSSNTWSS